MRVIGLTGGIGSGKSTVAALFAAKGITVIDTDQLAREVTQPGQPALAKIVSEFGETILNADGTLHRAQLRKIVFEQPEKRAWLEKLLHPLIRDELAKQIKQAQSPYVIAVIPLLVENLPYPLVDRILVVDTSVEQQLQRSKKRDQLPDAEIQKVLEAQLPREQRLAAADDIIYNNDTVDALERQVEGLHQLYMGLTGKLS